MTICESPEITAFPRRCLSQFSNSSQFQLVKYLCRAMFFFSKERNNKLRSQMDENDVRLAKCIAIQTMFYKSDEQFGIYDKRASFAICYTIYRQLKPFFFFSFFSFDSVFCHHSMYVHQTMSDSLCVCVFGILSKMRMKFILLLLFFGRVHEISLFDRVCLRWIQRNSRNIQRV